MTNRTRSPSKSVKNPHRGYYGKIYVPKDTAIVTYHSGICRDCGEKRTVDYKEQHSKSPPKCYNCGGLLDLSEEKLPTTTRKSRRKPKS